MKVFREKLREDHGTYFATYQPADSRLPFAVISLVFVDAIPDCVAIATTMERELEYWSKRFPVPAMVSSFDAKDDLLDLTECRESPHLTSSVSQIGEVAKHWKPFGDNASPQSIDDEGLERIYANVPYRSGDEVRRTTQLEAKRMKRAASLIVFFVVGLPLLVGIVSLGISWVGCIVTCASIATGMYKAAKTFGWIRPSERDQQRAEKRRKMDHYYYHCEMNPDGFNRLKVENFEREAVEGNRAEADAIRNSTINRNDRN